MCSPTAGSLIDVLNSYSNLIIAIFTIAIVAIAILQFWQAFLRGPSIRLHFLDESIAYQGPASLGDATILSAPTMATFFQLSLAFVNRSPRLGAVTKVRLELLSPNPKVKVRRNSGEEDAYMLTFRFEGEEGVNAPLSDLLAIEGNSAKGIQKAKCALLRTNISPGDVPPPAADLVKGPIRIRVTYFEAQKNAFSTRTVEREFQKLERTVYDMSYIESARKFLKL